MSVLLAAGGAALIGYGIYKIVTREKSNPDKETAKENFDLATPEQEKILDMPFGDIDLPKDIDGVEDLIVELEQKGKAGEMLSQIIGDVVLPNLPGYEQHQIDEFNNLPRIEEPPIVFNMTPHEELDLSGLGDRVIIVSPSGIPEIDGAGARPDPQGILDAWGQDENPQVEPEIPSLPSPTTNTEVKGRIII